MLLAEAEATLAQLHGFLLIPYLAQAEGYFREIAPHVFPGCDVDQERDLLAHRQAHQPRGPLPGRLYRDEVPLPQVPLRPGTLRETEYGLDAISRHAREDARPCTRHERAMSA